jgi:hypothetical protein
MASPLFTGLDIPRMLQNSPFLRVRLLGEEVGTIYYSYYNSYNLRYEIGVDQAYDIWRKEKVDES